MDSIIKNGITIIKMPKYDKNTNSKNGVLGVSKLKGRISTSISHNGKKYYFGMQDTLDEAKAIREEADNRIEDGSFVEWYEANFRPIYNKNGVKGLSYRKNTNNYQLSITYQNVKYYMGVFNDIEDAALVRSAADKRIADGTFLEWLEEYKTKKQHKG